MQTEPVTKFTDSLERELIGRSLADQGRHAFASAGTQPWLQVLLVLVAAGLALALF